MSTVPRVYKNLLIQYVLLGIGTSTGTLLQEAVCRIIETVL
jgi:hypothetical protein